MISVSRRTASVALPGTPIVSKTLTVINACAANPMMRTAASSPFCLRRFPPAIP